MLGAGPRAVRKGAAGAGSGGRGGPPVTRRIKEKGLGLGALCPQMGGGRVQQRRWCVCPLFAPCPFYSIGPRPGSGARPCPKTASEMQPGDLPAHPPHIPRACQGPWGRTEGTEERGARSPMGSRGSALAPPSPWGHLLRLPGSGGVWGIPGHVAPLLPGLGAWPLSSAERLTTVARLPAAPAPFWGSR